MIVQPARSRGFTLLEVLFAVSVVAFSLGAIYLTHWRTLQIVRQAHLSVNASQVLQEKAETLRGLSWSALTNSATVSGTFAGTPTTNEQQIQSVYSLTESITLSEYPTSPQPSPTGGYTVTRTINYSSGAAVASSAVSSSSPFPTAMTKLYGFLRVTWVMSSNPSATPYKRDFEIAISNPPL